MTSRTDPLAIPFVAAPRPDLGRLTFTFTLTLIAIMVFSAAFAFGYARMNEGRVLPGIDVAGTDLAGLNRDAAANKLRQALPSLSSGSLTVQVGSFQDTIGYSEFGRDYDFDYVLDQAFRLGRADNFVEQLREQIAILMNGVSVQPVMTWNSEELASRIAALVATAQVAPVDASIAREEGHYVVTPASVGTAVDIEQAVTMAMAVVNNLSPASTQISIQGTPVLPSVSTETAQAAVDRAERVVSTGLIVSGGDTSTTIDSDTLRGWVHLDEVTHGEWQLVIEAQPVAQFLSNYGLEVNVPPTNATFGFHDGVVEVIPSALGQAVDVETTTANVLTALQVRAEGQGPQAANLAVVPVEPDFNTAAAQEIASRVKLLGTWTTHYIPGISNGHGVNIQIPTRIIDGVVVNPGEQFDFLTAIGPITSPPYESGGVLIHGQIREDGAIGGGMCSTSTTLFNAAMRAGLKIDARGNHSIYISRYPVGLDATVWMSGSTRRTMAFTNDTAYPVLIKGINDRAKVTFEVYGVDDGRTVQLSDARVENVIEAGAWLEYSDELAAGERRKKQDAYDAFDSWVTRTVRDAQGNVIHEDTWVSHYRKLDAITLVGRYAGDPAAGTLIRPDQYPGAPRPTPSPTPSPDPSPGPSAPVAKWSASQQPDSKTINFSSTSTGVDHFDWDFGDGSSGTGQSTSHEYADFGNYQVTLTVSNANGSSSKTKTTHVVGPAPTPDPTPPSPAP
jgi:vancomycin resistance protein YoaR